MLLLLLLPWNIYINVKCIIRSNTSFKVDIYLLKHNQPDNTEAPGCSWHRLMHFWWLNRVIQTCAGNFKHQWGRSLDRSIALFINVIIAWKINLCSHLVCHFGAVIRKMGKKNGATVMRRSGREIWIRDEMRRSLIPSRQQALGEKASVYIQVDIMFFKYLLHATVQDKLLQPVYKFRLIQSKYLIC